MLGLTRMKACGIKLMVISVAMVLGYSSLSGAEPIEVAASIIPLGDFCQRLGGERVAVEVLIPPGASPHVYEPPPSKVAQAMRARLLVYVGAGLDPWAERVVKTRGSQQVKVVEAVKGLPLIREVEGHEHGHHPGKAGAAESHGGEEGHNHHEGGNPHVWLDPVWAQDICQRIAQALMELDPAHRQVYKANLAAYLRELEELHQEISGKVKTFRVREYVCFHPAFSYFARRYGLREAGVIEVSPGREPTPRHIQKIVEFLRGQRVKVVLAEPQLSTRVAEAVAREAGARVLKLDPLGGRPPYGTDYLALMRYNLGVLSEVMQ